MKTLYFLLTFLSLAGAAAQNPGQHWLRFRTPEQAGWSSKKLAAICRNSNANAVMLIQNGKVVYAYGEFWRRMKCHSMRKSFLGALYGIYIDRGTLDTGKSLAQLTMPNTTPLTAQEKQATIVHLLMSRSGIYLPSGQETEEMAASRPGRGSHPPGTFWYYNNWDFNVLGTIFRNETGRDIFQAFKSDIADPLQMEDFRLMDGVYDVELADISHPGYMFKMSARDAARFGQLFLQNGRWNGAHIVPQHWIERSTTSLSTTTKPGTTYGYLWWVVEDFHGVKMYSAEGHFGQRICVVPSLQLIVVINADSYSSNAVLDADYVLSDLVFTSRIGNAMSHPDFVPLEQPTPFQETTLSKEECRRYLGQHTLGESSITISQTDDGLVMSGYHFSYKFCLLPLSRNTFHVEDIDLLLDVDLDNRGLPTKLEIHKSEATRDLYRCIVERGVESASKEFPSFRGRFRHKEELEFLCVQLAKDGIPVLGVRELNALCFPYSYKVQSDLKNELLKKRNLDGAARVFSRLLDSVRVRKLAGTQTEWFATILTALTSETHVAREEEYTLAGDYGYRHVVVTDGTLYYSTSNSVAQRALHRISDTAFAIEGTYHMYVEFGRDESGRVNRIIGHYYRDSIDETYRSN